MLSKLIFTVCVNVFLIDSIQAIDFCGDWTAYKDIKCYKVLNDIRVTEEDALYNCTKLDNHSTLVSIHSQEEQEFLTSLLTQRKVSNNVWIGLKYSNTSFEWMDGQSSRYQNWDRDALKDGSLQCVQMMPSTGKWTDESCRKTALAVCQKKQEFDISLLKEIIYSLDQKLKDFENRTQKELSEMKARTQTELTEIKARTQNELSEIKASPIPIGFIYVQLPNQSEPDVLWPATTWSNITSDYAGLFFRAEGSGSEVFGKIQQANQSRITLIRTLSGHFDSWKGAYWNPFVTHVIDEGHWSPELVPGGSSALYSMEVFTTAAENRPRNTAVKIWKRVK